MQRSAVDRQLAMEPDHLKHCGNLVPASYLRQARESWNSRSNVIRNLFERQKLPDEGFSEELIEAVLSQLSQLDSNNMMSNCGAGEREGRIYSDLVARRHFRLAHGVGRSGDVTAVQPKAVGSSILNQLCAKLMLDIVRLAGARSAVSCIVVPMATGMTLLLCFLALKPTRPDAKYVVWPRIDQKSCFKAMVSAGFEPIVIENKLEGDELRTDVDAIEQVIRREGASAILCVHSTTSCFAPRVPDRLEEIAKLCKTHDIPHICNNAYGLQSSKCMHLVQQAMRAGRLDLFVQSCDKNLLVPVGGAIVASASRDLLARVAGTYAGRGSAAPAVDLVITSLQMGVAGFRRLLRDRKENFQYLKQELKKVAEKYGEKVLDTPHNPISMAMTLSSLTHGDDMKKVTELGSMLFTRRVSGARVVGRGARKEIDRFRFTGYGAHHDNYPHCYVTVAAALGMSRDECDLLVARLDKTFAQLVRHLPDVTSSGDVTSSSDVTSSGDVTSSFDVTSSLDVMSSGDVASSGDMTSSLNVASLSLTDKDDVT